MEDAANTPNELPLEASAAGGESPASTAPAASAAVSENVAASSSAAAKGPAKVRAAGAGSRTARKVSQKPARKAIGARKRPSPAASEAAAVDDGDRVTVVLQTSRFRGRDGRAIARRTPVLVTVDRGLELIMQGYARESVEGDKPGVAYLD